MDRYFQKLLVFYKGVFQPIVQPFVWTTRIHIQKIKKWKCVSRVDSELDIHMISKKYEESGYGLDLDLLTMS